MRFGNKPQNKKIIKHVWTISKQTMMNIEHQTDVTLRDRKKHMKYEEAIERWGAHKLLESYNRRRAQFVEIRDIKVDMDFNEGYGCCGGSDPDCYCSFAESPSAKVLITGTGVRLGGEEQRVQYSIEWEDFDFATVIKELFEISKK